MSELVEEVERFVRKLFTAQMPEWYSFHNLEHTIHVVEACQKIAAESNLTKHQLDVLSVAAWLHDTGYVEGRSQHEQRSANMAADYLRSQGTEVQFIEEVVHCILATEVPQQPTSELAQILCDADLSGLGALDYEQRSENLRLERERMDEKSFPVRDWLRSESHFYESHRYFTSAAMSLFGEQKQVNYQLLTERIARLGVA